jgi:hypothetical protein
MEHVSPWYLLYKCGLCEKLHDLGPYCSEAEAREAGEQLAEHTDTLLSEMNTEQRAPLTNDQIVEHIQEQCEMNMRSILGIAVLGKTLMPETNLPDPKKISVAIVQSVTVQVFMDFRPGCTVEDMHNALSADKDTIGETVGGMQ